MRLAKPLLERVFSVRPLNRVLCWRAARSGNAVAVTFDDGPSPSCTPAVLDILGKAGAKGTFFLDGMRVAGNPEVVRRIVEEGHEAANHGFGHRTVEFRAQTVDCSRALADSGIRTRLFRPPRVAPRVSDLAWLWFHGYRTVLFSVDTHDSMRHEGKWSGDAPDYAAVSEGDIVLMHDDNPVCVAELPVLLDSLERRGLRCVTVSELLGARR